MTPEGRIVAAVKKSIKDAGGEVRKAVWVGHNGCPDLFVMYKGFHLWVECKAPGKLPRSSQVREFKHMADLGGCTVLIIDSVELARLLPAAIEQGTLEAAAELEAAGEDPQSRASAGVGHA